MSGLVLFKAVQGLQGSKMRFSTYFSEAMSFSVPVSQ